MSDDQFTKLFKYIEAFRTDVNSRFEEARADRADIRSAIGELSAQVRDYHNEMTVTSRWTSYGKRYFKLPRKQGLSSTLSSDNL